MDCLQLQSLTTPTQLPKLWDSCTLAGVSGSVLMETSNKHKNSCRAMVENRPCKNKGEQRFNYFCNSHGPTQSNKKRRRYSNADRIIFTSKQRKQILETYGSICYLCKKEIHKGSYWHIDHIHPWSKGGSNNIANLRPTHPKCNEIKSAKIINNGDLWLKVSDILNVEGYAKALHYLWLTKAYMTCQRAWVWFKA